VIPCQSLLDDPEGTSAATVNRRLQVRQRNLDFNQVLREECGAVLRCRYDGDLLFNRSSNRTTPPNGPVAPRAQWWFEDDDISHNTGTFAWACPAPGILSGGTICGDHFHPSLRGQGKLAAAGHEASFQFQTDTTAPTRTITLDRPADGDGVYAGPVGVTFGGDDGAGLRGQEVRVHQPNGSVGAWQQHLGVAPPLTVSATGTTYVEVRSLDVNGNLSASLLQPVTIAPDQFGDVVGTVSGPGGPVAGAEVRLHAAGAQGVVATDTTDGSGAYAFTDLLASGDVKIEVVDPSGVHQGAWAGGADHATATVVDVPGGGTVTVDVALALTPGTLAGTVTDAAGPVEGVEVTVHAAGAEGVVAQAVTGADGTYTVDLVPGDYRVRFVDPTGVHAGEWHADATNHATATTATVTRTTTTTVDAELAVIPGGVTGTVTGPDGPVVGVTVTVDGAAPTATDDAGAYTVTGLAPGDHTVSVAGVACATTGAQVGVAVPTGGGTAVADVTVTAVTPAANGFPDVADALDPAVDWLVDPCHQPLRLAGFGDGTFRPTAVLTRGQAVLSLWHIAGRPAVSTPHRLRGVPATLAPAVRWAVAARHLTGRADGTFGAGVAITRGDLARFVHRVAAPGPTTTPHGLTDVPRRLEQAVRWLVAEGVAAPTGTRFRPTAPARRGLYATWAFEIA